MLCLYLLKIQIKLGSEFICSSAALPPSRFGQKLLLPPVQVEESGSSGLPEGVPTPSVSSEHNSEELNTPAAPCSSAVPSRSAESGAGSGRVSPSEPPESPHKEFHCAVLRALSVTPELSGQTLFGLNSGAAGTRELHLPSPGISPAPWRLLFVGSPSVGAFLFVLPHLFSLGDPVPPICLLVLPPFSVSPKHS